MQEMIRTTIHRLSQEIGSRPAGSTAQRRSEAYIAGVLQACGLAVEVERFDAPWWEVTAVSLRLGGTELPALANPYTPACRVAAPLVVSSTLEELQAAPLTGAIAVLTGELTSGQLSPRNFNLFPDERRDAILQALEQQAPAAIITVSESDEPLPIIEDADFALPSVTVSRQVGARLISAAGATAELTVDATREPGCAAHVIARGPAAPSGKRIVVAAHYDTKFYTPGATDNATGVAALLALAERLSAANATRGIELIAFGAEDSWFPAEIGHAVDPTTIAAMINIDGVGVKGHPDSVAFLSCPDDLVAEVLQVKAHYPEIEQADPWYAGDHGLFWPLGIPCLAITSIGSLNLLVAHTPHDTADQADSARVAETVDFVADVLHQVFRVG